MTVNIERMPIVLPELGTPSATFSLWHVGIGEPVSQGERLAEVLIPGVAVELQAHASGVLIEAIARPGDKFRVEAILGFIEIDEANGQ